MPTRRDDNAGFSVQPGGAVGASMDARLTALASGSTTRNADLAIGTATVSVNGPIGPVLVTGAGSTLPKTAGTPPLGAVSPPCPPGREPTRTQDAAC